MNSECVKVVVRCRPMNQRESKLQAKSVVLIDSSLCQCSIINPADSSAPRKSFTFDAAYSTESTTESIYNEIAYPLVEGVLEGYNSTVFAYGQTGCGKSFTMQGVNDPVCNKGIIPRAFEHIFEAIETSDQIKYLVHASYLEIYNEEIRDLLGVDTKKRLDLKEHPDHGVYINDLSQHNVHNVDECEELMTRGWKNRSVGATLMNADSSRSHSIFTISIEMMDDNSKIRKGKLNLVDLAGSERQAKTGATGDRLKEATKINLSLSALGNVISALVDGKSPHIPYRDSKLTRLLQDSLGGNTKTLMVACISPADNNYDETLSTLRYANRAKNIKNKPRINQDPKDALLLEYQKEIQELKTALEQQKSSLGDTPLTQMKLTDVDVDMERQKIREEYENELETLRKSYVQEKESYAKLQQDMSLLRNEYEQKLEEVQTSGSDKKVGADGKRGSSQNQLNEDASLTTEQQEALARLQAIEDNMVGGERAHDKELKEKRLKKKKAAEKRGKLLRDALSRATKDDDAFLIKAYDNVQEELRANNEALKKSKQKIRALEREVSDLYSEFQNDRTDYLETIRRQDQQLKLLQGILDNVQPVIRKNCNYSNLDMIKSQAVWSDETQKWRLPVVSMSKTILPPTGQNTPAIIQQGFNNTDNDSFRVLSSSRTAPARFQSETEDDDNDNRSDILDRKFETKDTENFTENYFKPRRAAELLVKAQQDATRVIRLARKANMEGTQVKIPNANVVREWNGHINSLRGNVHDLSLPRQPYGSLSANGSSNSAVNSSWAMTRQLTVGKDKMQSTPGT